MVFSINDLVKITGSETIFRIGYRYKNPVYGYRYLVTAENDNRWVEPSDMTLVYSGT
jgi:hypothetical protein